MPGQTPPYLLHYAPDNASLIVRLALDELGVPYRTVLVDRSRQEQRSAAFRAVNPARKIPALVTPSGPIVETAAILLWLSDTHGRLAPGPGAPDRGARLSWLVFVSNTLHADMRALCYPADYVAEANGPAFQARLADRIAAHLTLIEDMARTAPDWCRAGIPSILTLYLACLLRWLAIYPKAGDRDWFRAHRAPVADNAPGRLLGVFEWFKLEGRG